MCICKDNKLYQDKMQPDGRNYDEGWIKPKWNSELNTF